MANTKQDYLGLCNETKIPFQDFMAAFCSRCFQQDCSRSMHGNSRFEDRALNWESRLFTQVSKLDPQDERFRGILAKKFLTILPTGSGSTGSWLDPRDIETTKEILIPAVEQVIQVTQVAVPKRDPDPDPAEPARPAGMPEPVLRNTRVQARQMIGGHDPKSTQPVLNDPWQPAQALKSDEVLVQPGARIKLGK